jgi:hypothetical protein
LLLNIGFLIARITNLDFSDKNLLTESTTFTAGVIIAAGYLAGAVLRLLKTEAADVCSTKVRRLLLHISRSTPPEENRIEQNDPKPDDRTRDRNVHGYYQKFPYENWLCTKVAKGLGPDVQRFVRTHWARSQVPQLDTTFVNHYKTIFAHRSPSLYAQLMAEEALVRFVASMFYALCISLVILSVSWIFAVQADPPKTIIEPILLLTYVAAIVGILLHFRHLRAKEAAMFLSACFAYQLNQDDHTSTESKVDNLETEN